MTSLQQKDTTFTKIFVGGLPYHTTDDTLQRFFEPYGEIDEAVVITDRQTGKSRGYGFVTMSDRAAAERACKDPNPIIDGRKANVNLAYLGAKPRIPVGELIAAFPYGLKTGLPSYFSGAELLGLPQIVYQSGTTAAYLPATPTSFTIAAAPQAPTPHLLPAALLPATGGGGGVGHFLDYAALAAAYSAATTPLTTSTIPLGSDSMPTVAAAFPYNAGGGGGGGGGGSGYFSTPTAPTAYATLQPYATGAFPTQTTVLGQFTTQQFHTQHVHTTKLQ